MNDLKSIRALIGKASATSQSPLRVQEVRLLLKEIEELRVARETLRDRCAMWAPPMIGNGGNVRPRTPDEAYKWADEMLAARKGAK